MEINLRSRDSLTLREPCRASLGDDRAFLSSPLASGITGTTVYVDKGYHAMGVPVDQPLLT